MTLNSKAEVVAKLRPAIAMVEDVSLPRPGDRKIGDSIVGTAFVADVRGYLLTAKHVVRGLRAKDLELRTTYSVQEKDGYAMRHLSISAIYLHPFDDVAVLATKISIPPARAILPRATGDALVGSDVLLMGYAVGTDLVFCDDVLGAGSAKSYSPVAFTGMICARIPDDGRQLELLAYDCTTFAGNSGAPVVSIETGQIIALHLRGFENHVGYGIPIDRCMQFVETVAEVHEDQKVRQREARTARRLSR